jgi:hypothetical protein
LLRWDIGQFSSFIHNRTEDCLRHLSVGPFIAAGPIMAALSGVTVGAATGGVVGGLIGLGIPEIEAKRYEEKLKKGNYLIAVHADVSEDIDRAKHIFKTAGAEDISTVTEASASRV